MSEVDKQVSELMSIYTSHEEYSVLKLIKKLIKKVDEYIHGGAVVGRKVYRHNVVIDDDHDSKFTLCIINTSNQKIDTWAKLFTALGDPDEEVPVLVTGEYNRENIMQATWKGGSLKLLCETSGWVYFDYIESFTFDDDIMEI